MLHGPKCLRCSNDNRSAFFPLRRPRCVLLTIAPFCGPMWTWRIAITPSTSFSVPLERVVHSCAPPVGPFTLFPPFLHPVCPVGVPWHHKVLRQSANRCRFVLPQRGVCLQCRQPQPLVPRLVRPLGRRCQVWPRPRTPLLLPPPSTDLVYEKFCLLDRCIAACCLNGSMMEMPKGVGQMQGRFGVDARRCGELRISHQDCRYGLRRGLAIDGVELHSSAVPPPLLLVFSRKTSISTSVNNVSFNSRNFSPSDRPGTVRSEHSKYVWIRGRVEARGARLLFRGPSLARVSRAYSPKGALSGPCTALRGAGCQISWGGVHLLRWRRAQRTGEAVGWGSVWPSNTHTAACKSCMHVVPLVGALFALRIPRRGRQCFCRGA